MRSPPKIMNANNILEAIRTTGRELAESNDPIESAIGRALRTIIARAEREELSNPPYNES